MSARALRAPLSHVRPRPRLPTPRRIQHAALAAQPPPTFPELPVSASEQASHGRRRRRHGLSIIARAPDSSSSLGPISALARTAEALANAAESEKEKEAAELSFSEAELEALYEDVLALPNSLSDTAVGPPVAVSTEKHDSAVVEDILARYASEPEPLSSPETFLAVLQERSGIQLQQHRADTGGGHSSLPPHQLAVARLRPLIHDLLASQDVAASTSGQHSTLVPLSLLSPEEWRSLIRASLAHDDPRSAQDALELMTASLEPTADIMSWYAGRGDTLGIERFLETSVRGPLTDRQRHLHIKAHEKSVPPGTVPESALTLLHTYENAGKPAPMPTYSRLIAALFRTRSSPAAARAWDLFAHMRYVAHPHPDAHLYTQMIRACALPTPAEPERALDLFTEMTVDRALPPTAAAYTAAILACARSGAKAYVREAFRLAKQMLDAHRDARGRAEFRPDAPAFRALLEGAKRVGDLARARWLLAEMVEAARHDPRVVVDARAMEHVLHAYAAYRPPFRRAMAPLIKEGAAGAQAQGSTPAPTGAPHLVESSAAGDGPSADAGPPAPTEAPTDAEDADADAPSFAHLPPQSRAEVLNEARALFARITQPSPSPAPASDALPTFPHVRPTARLLSAYLAVLYAHAPLPAAHAAFRTLFAAHGVPHDAHAPVAALERCAAARRGAERSAAAGAFADEAWAAWAPLERGAPPRLVQRAYAARIRVFALTHRLDDALACLRAFVAAYPPAAVRAPAPAPAHTQRGHALVRLSTPLDVADDGVPPLLTFGELEVLHHRLVGAGRTRARDVAYVTWVCRSYEGALWRRREVALGLGRGAA
ncbi:hypothetical protein BC834DRAFT_967432 [Gloeopeniophorella convolvens]|nr:hypothetical protein BC834DRAFT_967432 [Gloeopeniophorella convolvens]